NRLMGVEGRMPDWDRIAPRYIDGFDLLDACPGPSMPVAKDALAHLAHRGILAELHVLGDAADWSPLQRDHVAPLLAQPGVLAGLHFPASPLPDVDAPWESGAPDVVAPPRPTRLDLYLLDQDPAAVAADLRACSDGAVRPSGGATRMFHG